jgi:curli biogenesis system outer membrane secretion channel CsgG
MMLRLHRALISAALTASMAAGITVPSTPAFAKKTEVVLPHCARPMGTAAVRIPSDTQNWWGALHLSSPETLVKSLVRESNCFTLLDRGVAMELADEERARAAQGDLQSGSNLGKGQVKVADYIIVPSMLSKNNSAGGTSIGGILGSVFGGTIGAVLGGLNIKKKTADVHLEVVDVRTSEVVASADGHAKKRDLSFGGGAGAASWGGLGAFGASSYANTDMGRVLMAAYINAYVQVVQQQGGVLDLPQVAGSTAPPAPDPVVLPQQASFTVTRTSNFRGGPSTSTKILRTLSPGSLVYPTGEASGNWLKVTTEDGIPGWISSLSLHAN